MGRASDVLDGLEEKSPGMEIRAAMEKMITMVQTAVDVAKKAGDKQAEKLLLKLKQSAKETLFKWSSG